MSFAVTRFRTGGGGGKLNKTKEKQPVEAEKEKVENRKIPDFRENFHFYTLNL